MHIHYIRHRAPSTAWRDSFFERSEYNDFNTQWSMIPTMVGHSSFTNIRAARPNPHYPSKPPSWPWNHFFGFQLRTKNLIRLESPEIHLTRPKTLPKLSPRPSQNVSKIASYLPTPEILKKCNPPIRKPHFWRSRPFKNRPQIDAKTPSKSASFWIPSWNLKKYDFWC